MAPACVTVGVQRTTEWTAPCAPFLACDVTAALEALAREYTRLLVEHLGERLVSVVLFGSVARGEATAGSDVDLIVVCEAMPAGRFARLRLLEPADRRLEADLARLRAGGVDTRLAVILKTREEARHAVPLYLDMVEDARLLLDRDGFFAAVLDRLRARLRALGAERRRRGRARYWVLARDFTPGEVIEL
jgi:predicted nucleotidyltransferase